MSIVTRERWCADIECASKIQYCTTKHVYNTVSQQVVRAKRTPPTLMRLRRLL